MNVKTLLALSIFALLLGCAGSQQAPAQQPSSSTQQPSAAVPSAIGGVELGYDESQSLNDIDAANTAQAAPSAIGGVELSFDEAQSLSDVDSAAGS